jgi:hypothetical protein
VTPGYVILSIGTKHSDDILADIDQALKAALINLELILTVFVRAL